MTSAWLQAFLPQRSGSGPLEQVRAAVGAILGIAATAFVAAAVLGEHLGLVLLLIAPMGASAVLLFAAPTSPLAQPWPVLAGNTLSAAVGVTSLLLLGYTVLAAAVALGLAVAAMFLTRSLHPPGGASALAGVMAGPSLSPGLQSFAFVLDILVNSACLLAVALLFNNLTGRRYPSRATPTAVPPATPEEPPRPAPAPATITTGDLAAVLALYDEGTPVAPDELAALYRFAEQQREAELAEAGVS